MVNQNCILSFDHLRKNGGSKDFALDYIQSVFDDLAFWQDDSDNKNLKNIISECKKLNLLCILDSKIADIGSTNKVWLESQKKLYLLMLETLSK